MRGEGEPGGIRDTPPPVGEAPRKVYKYDAYGEVIADAETPGHMLGFCHHCKVAISPMTKERGMRCEYCENR